MKQLFYEFKNEIINYLFPFLLVLLGVVIKIQTAISKGKKPSFSWFLAEFLVSLFVAFSVYTICGSFFNLSKMVTYVICAWGGSFSTLIHAQVEALLVTFFESIKKYIKFNLTSK